MAAPHHGHIICLYAGRAIYCPKMATLQATLKAALECLGLPHRDVHFAFPHSDLAILVEISALAFKNVRDGAILYLCDGRVGPTYPHELALQAQEGQARRPAAVAAAAAAHAEEEPPAYNGPGIPAGGLARGVGAPNNRNVRAITAAPDIGSNNAGTDHHQHHHGRAAVAANERGAARPGARANANTSTPSSASARATRATRRSKRQAAADADESVAPAAAAENDNANTAQEEDNVIGGAPGPSSRPGSAADEMGVKVEVMDHAHDEQEEEDNAAARAGARYFKKRKLTK